jgi:hypothetical protein
MSRGEDTAKRWQFSIRHLLTLMAVVAVIAAIAPRTLAAFAYVLVLCLAGASFYLVAFLISRLLLWLFPSASYCHSDTSSKIASSCSPPSGFSRESAAES